VQQRLALPLPAPDVVFPAVLFDLGDMPCHRFPAPDLTRVVRAAPAQVIPAIPLEPAAWIIGIDPSFFLLFGR